MDRTPRPPRRKTAGRRTFFPVQWMTPRNSGEAMPTDLALHIQNVPLADTHEHLRKESEWVENGPDILQDLFGNYVPADLIVAGARPEAMKRLMDAADPDLRGRFAGVRDAWEATPVTGYGEAVRLIAGQNYGLPELKPAVVVAAHATAAHPPRAAER